MPEPPALDPKRVGLPEVTTTLAPIVTIPVVGTKGAAPANAIVRLTNLDSTATPIATTANADGAFSLSISGTFGDELRLQAVLDDQRSAPIDFVFRDGTPPTLTASLRYDCVTLSPGFELAFDGPEARSLTLRNDCAETVRISNPRSRLGLTAFTLITALPLDLAPGAEVALDVNSSAAAGSAEEDALFLDLTRGGGVLRYPVTLVAP